jgi:hypothetical protein
MLLKLLMYVLTMSTSYHTDSMVCHVPQIARQPIVDGRRVNTVCITKEAVFTAPSTLIPGSTYSTKGVYVHYEDDIDNPLITTDPDLVEWVENI